jgi:uncharacterized protein (DUF1810 family)
MTAADPFALQRFVDAQAPVFEAALRELAAGRKRTHWMWFVFPQLRGLGRSPTAQLYGIASLAEAQAYLAHPLLGARLRQATQVVTAVADRTLHAIFGSPDDIKFCSSMTLFMHAAGEDGAPFRQALDRHCGGRADARTVAMLAAG